MRKSFPPKVLLIAMMAFFATHFAFSQNTQGIIQNYLQEHQAEWNLTHSDISNWIITDQHTSKHNQVTHVYIKQTHNNIEVFNGVANFAIQNGKVFHAVNRMVHDVSGTVNATSPALNPMDAAQSAADHLQLNVTSPFRIITAENPREFFLNDGGISRDEISAKLVYQPTEEGLKLAWELVINETESADWWNIRVDAMDGTYLDKFNHTVYCNFDGPHDHDNCNPITDAFAMPNPDPAPAPALPLPRVNQPDAYRVFPIPVESPNHGGRQLVVNPADSVASPYGWHDTNGQPGAEYQITRGNNVYASEDRNADNQPGFSPSGGALLEFDFPLNLNQQPQNYESAAITNLFFWNNLMHDIWYQYGFDEASGNFQTNNYGNGGSAGDEVNADAQDGGGTNNANFSTPGDGSSGRMQMFLWSTGGSTSSNLLTVNSPSVIQGVYSASTAAFGPAVPSTPITQNVVIADDGTNPNTADACETITNTSAMNGKIALIDRGDCLFWEKVNRAQTAGAVAVIMVNNVAGAPITMGGTPTTTISIPTIMISQADGNLIKAQINNGQTVNATIQDPGGANIDKDGDLDNGIIAHEYGHGISIRLTGGRLNSGCLSGSEQMGEGWSDYFGIVMTMKPGDTATDIRGVGTYAVGQPTNGVGIRPAAYSTDLNINNFTYGDISSNTVSVPHGVGFVWCTMLWDMTWALIDQYGWDPDLYNGTGGNNIAMQLVIDGIKLQGCDPGFVDGRDAILAADVANNGGANQCLIWEAFAARGLGFSAQQGSSASRSDGTEAFDLHPNCLVPTSAPDASFTFSADCSGQVSFTDASTDVPQSWSWNFGDGNTSTLQNPTHTYAANGTYTVTLTVSNTVGNDVSTQSVTISAPVAPTNVQGASGCPGTFTLTAQSSGNIVWQNNQGNTVGTGTSFTTPTLFSNATYTAYTVQGSAPVSAGPVNPNFGGGGYFDANVDRVLNFTASVPFTLNSAWVDADGAGNRDFVLWDGPGASGNIVQQLTVFCPDGQSRINLGFDIPAAGDYSIGGSNMALYRNNSGPNYPYTTPGVVSITSSNAGSNPVGFYYFLYDWEVVEDSCFSPWGSRYGTGNSSELLHEHQPEYGNFY